MKTIAEEGETIADEEKILSLSLQLETLNQLFILIFLNLPGFISLCPFCAHT